jgi:CIC family chloride channel protein
LGGFLSGALGLSLFFPLNWFATHPEPRVLAVLSFGYGILQDALSATRPSVFFALVLLCVAFGKILTTGLTIGSGGSGGVFGPSMVIGGWGGGALGSS